MIKHLIIWIMFLPVLNVNAQTAPGATKMTAREKRLAKIAAEHKTWDNCFVITDKGDTVLGKIKPGKANETLDKVYNPFIDYVLFFTFPNDSECTIFPYTIKQLYVFDAPAGFRKYITVQLKDQYAIASKAFCLVQVVEDGKCQLLSYERIVQIGMGGRLTRFYYVMYNNQLQSIPGSILPDVRSLTANFRKRCSEIFADCPALVDQINNKEFYYDDIPAIVKKFNNCVADKYKPAGH